MKTQIMKITKFGCILLGLFCLAGVFDLITFLKSKGHHIFELNPIYILTKSYIIMILFKIVIIVCFIYVFIKFAPLMVNRYRFLFIVLLVYLTFAQVGGGISNLYVMNTVPEPTPDMANPPIEAVKTYGLFVLFAIYLPVLLTFLTFLCYEFAFRQKYDGE